MANPVRNVTSARPHGNRFFLATLQCGHQVMCPSIRIRGSRFSVRAPLTATCNQCPKESTHG